MFGLGDHKRCNLRVGYEEGEGIRNRVMQKYLVSLDTIFVE